MKYIIRLIGTLTAGCTAEVEVEASSQQEAEDKVWAMSQSPQGVDYENTGGRMWPEWDEVELAEGPEDELPDSTPAATSTVLDETGAAGTAQPRAGDAAPGPARGRNSWPTKL